MNIDALFIIIKSHRDNIEFTDSTNIIDDVY